MTTDLQFQIDQHLKNGHEFKVTPTKVGTYKFKSKTTNQEFTIEGNYINK